MTEAQKTATEARKAGELQRYEPEIWREDRIRMEPDSLGDWVKFDDVAALLSAQALPVGESEAFEECPSTSATSQYGADGGC